MSGPEMEISRAGEVYGKAIAHLKREECECPLLEPSPKRRPSPKREARATRGFSGTSRGVGVCCCC